MKKIISLILATLLVLTTVLLWGCSGNTPADNTSQPTVSDEDASSTPSEPQVEYFKEPKQIIDLNTVWQYLDDGTDPSPANDRTSWTAVDFDDSGWQNNQGTEAVFGAKAGQLADLGSGFIPKVLLKHYKTGTTCVPTYFFRATFNLEQLPDPSLSLVGTLLYDDAAIIYLNGTRIAAFDEPEGGFANNLSYGGSGNVEPKEVGFSVDASLLQLGKNVLSVELHNQRNNSSDIYFSMPDFSAALPEIQSLSMNVGEDETKRNFTWYINIEEEGMVQYAPRNGDKFPDEYVTVTSATEPYQNTYIHRATIDGLKPNTEYVYRIVNGASVSESYYFQTDPEDSFNFIFVGDPQIGGSWGGQDDAGEWAKTLDLATKMFPDTSFLISAGDQVETCTNEEHYKGFLASNALSGLAIATTVGNHDTEAGLYSQHFNNPNTLINGEAFGATAAGCDYWYTYNNALFMHINANNLSVAEHKAFIQNAIMQNLNVQWKIVVMHHGMFGAGPYFTESVIENLRNSLAPVMEEFDIDVVLNGHEHIYARTYMIEDGFTPYMDEGVQSTVHNPKGILYVTGSSSSGSKYYNLHDDASVPHAAVKEKNVTTFSNVEITETSFKITTYRTKDKSVLDSFEITKDPITAEPTYPEWTHDMVESITAEDFSMMLNTSYAGGAVKGTTYGGETVVIGIKDTQINLVSANGSAELNNGVLTAIKEGTATVSFTYTSKMPYGSTYTLTTEPVTLTVNQGDKFSLAILIKAAEHISKSDYSEERFGEIKTLLDDALAQLQLVNADNEKISSLCVSLAKALSDYCVNKSVSVGCTYTTTEPNYHSFSDSFVDDGKRLSDGKSSTASPTVNSYAAWNNSVNPVIITLDLSEPTCSNSYSVYSVGGFWGIKNCASIKVYGSNDGESFVQLGGESFITELGNAAEVDDTQTTLNSVTVVSDKTESYRYIKFEISVNGNFLWIDEVEARLIVGTPME